MDERDEVAWCNQRKHADNKGGNVYCQNDEKIELHGHGADIIGGWVERYYSRVMLKRNESYAHDVAP